MCEDAAAAWAYFLVRKRAEAAERRVKTLKKIVRGLIDCHADRCEGRPGVACRWPSRGRKVLKVLEVLEGRDG